MHAGYYAGRRPKKSHSNKFVIVESRPFQVDDEAKYDEDRVRRDVWRWASFIQTEHPNDDVFIFQVSSLEDFEKSFQD